MQAEALARLTHFALAACFEASPSSTADPLDRIIVQRPLLDELSKLQQLAWKLLLLEAGRPVGIPEFSRELDRRGFAVSVDELRRALNVLTAAGAAVESRSRRWHSWRAATAAQDDV
jgi:hypothetical protein